MTPRRPAASSPAQDWSRALALTSSISRQPRRTLPGVIDEIARTRGDAPALLSRDACVTFRALADRSAHYARWAVDRGVAAGGVVALLMPNCPEYAAVWLGVTSVGGVVALLNTNLSGPALAHCINVAAPAHVIVDASLAARVAAVRSDLSTAPALWIRDALRDELHPASKAAERRGVGEEAATGELPAVTIHDRALCIYTSGTTGWPKAALVSHGRLMQWTHWFAGLMDVQPADRMYNCLPMYHSVGGVVATGAALVGGASVFVGEKFSTRGFWRDVGDFDCTLFQYIGELCRYLVNAAPQPRERNHRLRLCCGNGLAAGVWSAFASRFRIPRILEFYASTEGNVSLVNVEGEPGAIGRVPRFLAHRFPMALVRVDDEGAPLRDARGLCVECGTDEVGEAVGPLQRGSNAGAWFEGYTDAGASERKILSDVRAPGDAWVRTGDLMRRDDRGFVFFVDRIGDTFRWKGENVAAAEVADAIGRCPGVAEAAVYGVAVPRADGRAGMAALVAGDGFDLRVLHAHLAASLPEYARPLFVRLAASLEVTGTLRHTTGTLARDGYDPARIADPLYVDDRDRQSYVKLDTAVYDRIQSGRFLGIQSCALVAAV